MLLHMLYFIRFDLQSSECIEARLHGPPIWTVNKTKKEGRPIYVLVDPCFKMPLLFSSLTAHCMKPIVKQDTQICTSRGWVRTFASVVSPASAIWSSKFSSDIRTVLPMPSRASSTINALHPLSTTLLAKFRGQAMPINSHALHPMPIFRGQAMLIS